MVAATTSPTHSAQSATLAGLVQDAGGNLYGTIQAEDQDRVLGAFSGLPFNLAEAFMRWVVITLVWLTCSVLGLF